MSKSTSTETVISCNGKLIVGRPISLMEQYEGQISENDYIVISKNEGEDNYASYKYSFGQFDNNYVHTTGDQDITGLKSFEKLKSDKVHVNEEIDTVKIDEGEKVRIGGDVEFTETSKITVSGDILMTGGTIKSDCTTEISGTTVFRDGGVISAVLNNKGLETRFFENEVKSVVKTAKGDEDNVLDIKILNDGNTDISVGNVGNRGRNVNIYVSNPGNMSDVSSLDRAATTKYIGDNYVNIPTFEQKIDRLSTSIENLDTDTLHKGRIETIVQNKYLSSGASIGKIVNGTHDDGFTFVEGTNLTPFARIAGEKTDTSRRLSVYMSDTESNGVYDNGITMISEPGSRTNSKVQLMKHPADKQYGLDVSTTQWTRDNMIERDDQTHNYSDIVNAPTRSEVARHPDKAKKSPSVTAVKDYNDYVIKPEIENALSDFLSNYVAYDYDGEEGKRRVHLSEMRLMKFTAYYESKTDEPLDFYVLTPVVK